MDITDPRQILNMPLFYNERFLFNDKSICFNKIYERGIRIAKIVKDKEGNM